tara:strand:- start:19201 stop:19665 length:465 start_codon:yes stop_codon:yes gene_type:complete
MIAYLSGGMEYAPKGGSAWRNEITDWLKVNLNHNVINPVNESKTLAKKKNILNYRDLQNSDPKRYLEFIRSCIDNDLKLIFDDADYIITLWDDSVLNGGGTHGEVTMGYYFKKPVYLINNLSSSKMSGWISSCSTEIFNSMHQLKTFLKQEYKL